MLQGNTSDLNSLVLESGNAESRKKKKVKVFNGPRVFVAATALCIMSTQAQVLLEDDAVQVDTKEIVQAYEHVIPESRQAMMRSKESNIRGFLLDYFTYKRLAEAAREKGVDRQPGTVMRQQYLTNRLLTEVLIDDYIATSAKPDFEAIAQEYYQTEKSSFILPEQVHARHILLEIGKDESEAEVLQRANALIKELKKDLSRFEELAKEHSSDPSAEVNGGDLGFFQRGQMVKPFEEAAFALKKDKLSKPVKTDFGYHIIHVLEKQKEQQQSYAEVKEALIARAVEDFRNVKRLEVVNKYRESPKVKIHDEAIADLVKQLLDEQP